MSIDETQDADTRASGPAGTRPTRRDRRVVPPGGVMLSFTGPVAPATASGPDEVPTTIGRYHVLTRLGAGGMGVVFSAYDPELDRRVAVKLLRADRSGPDRQVRLLREAQALARLSHPNVVQVHDAGVAGGQVFVAMEFVRGHDLRAWLAARTRTPAEIVAVFLDAGRGLAAAHDAGLVHRDFKPHNVMVDAAGAVKVLDFGLARTSDGDVQDDLRSIESDGPTPASSTLLTTLTRTGALIGTPAYMSPEQHRGALATAASDQYSFCVSLHEALYGGLPLALAEPRRIGSAPPGGPVPARVQQALRRGMAVEPDQRFASMRELLTALMPAAPLRRTGVLMTIAALLGGAGLAFAFARDSVERCPDAHAELAAIWDPGRIDAVRTSVRAALPYADAVLPRIEGDLTRYAEAWVHMRNDACLAHAEGRQSAQLFDLRTACLDRRRASLRAVTETLATPAPESREHLVGAVVGLPPLELCADAAALTAEVAPPEDPALRARVDRHFEGLAQANVYMDTSQLRRARDLVEAVLADPEVRSYEPVLAQAHLYRGYLQEYDGEKASVLDSYTRALSAALSGGHDILAAQASSARMYYLATRLERIADAKAEAWLVMALNHRARRDVDTFGRYLFFMAALHANDGDIERGMDGLREAVAFRERHGRDRTREHLATLGSLGLYAATLGRHAEAAAYILRGIERSEQVLGPYYAGWYFIERELAHSTIELGRPREALGRLQRVLDARADAVGAVEGAYYQGCMAHAEVAMGDPAAAYRRVSDALRRPAAEETREYWAELMWIAAVNGDAEGMQRAADEALRDLDGLVDRHGLQYQLTLLRHGQALAALGRREEAIVPLLRATSALSGSQLPLDVVRRAALSLELGKLRGGLAAFDAAERDLRDALSGFKQVATPRSLKVAETMQALGELAGSRGRPAESVAWLVEAESIYSASAELDYPPLVQTRAALAEARAAAATTAAHDSR